MNKQSKQQSPKKISAADSQFMKIAKASHAFSKKNEELISVVDKRAKLLDGMFSKKHASLKTSEGLQDLSKKIAATSSSIKASISEISDKLDAAYICSVKASSEKQKKIASKLITAHALDLETLSQHQVYFDLLSKKVAADLAEMNDEISDEQFLEIDENGYIEEPESVADEAEQFNETFTSEDDESEEEESEEMKEDEKDEFDSSFKSEEMEDDSEQFPDPEFDEETLNQDSEMGFQSGEDLDDESILDTLEDPEEIIEEDLPTAQSSAAPKASQSKVVQQKTAQSFQKEKKLAAYCTPQSTKHSSRSEDDLIMSFLSR